VFLFLPLLARLRFDQLVEQAGYPGSKMVPAGHALLSYDRCLLHGAAFCGATPSGLKG
jgi:hypothetical protein